MQKWKWLVKALIFGAIVFLAILLVKPLGVATQFSVFTGIIHKAVDPSVISGDNTSGYTSTNALYNKDGGWIASKIENPNYDFILVLAIPLGALAGYTFRKRKGSKEAVYTDDLDVPETRRKDKGLAWVYVPSFIGGFLLLFGARIAGGCTSGHMMSGMMQGSVSGFIFAGVAFAVAIPTALIVGKLGKNRGGY